MLMRKECQMLQNSESENETNLKHLICQISRQVQIITSQMSETNLRLDLKVLLPQT